MDIGKGLIAIGAGLAVMAGMMTGIGQGWAAASAVKAQVQLKLWDVTRKQRARLDRC